MTTEQKDEITTISKEFASGFKPDIPEIAGSGWLIVDPLSGFLNASGFKNTLEQLPATEKRPLILIMTFEDGSQFIPAGSDMKQKVVTDWMWLDAAPID